MHTVNNIHVWFVCESFRSSWVFLLDIRRVVFCCCYLRFHFFGAKNNNGCSGKSHVQNWWAVGCRHITESDNDERHQTKPHRRHGKFDLLYYFAFDFIFSFLLCSPKWQRCENGVFCICLSLGCSVRYYRYLLIQSCHRWRQPNQHLNRWQESMGSIGFDTNFNLQSATFCLNLFHLHQIRSKVQSIRNASRSLALYLWWNTLRMKPFESERHVRVDWSCSWHGAAIIATWKWCARTIKAHTVVLESEYNCQKEKRTLGHVCRK